MLLNLNDWEMQDKQFSSEKLPRTQLIKTELDGRKFYWSILSQFGNNMTRQIDYMTGLC